MPRPVIHSGIKFSLISLGCPKNLVDSEQTIFLLEKSGFLFTQRYEDAAIIIVNTCGFIQSSKEESVTTILEMAKYKQQGNCRKLIVMGCLTELYQDQLMKLFPEVDAVVGTWDYPKMAKIIGELEGHSGITLVSKIANQERLNAPRSICTLPHTAYLKIAEGCDHLCAFCIIPRIRGKQISRPIEVIVKEAKQLAGQGVKEINLIAQDLTDYGRDLYGKRRLPELLAELNKIPPIKWIRLMYTYPNLITDELISAIATLDKVCNYIDVPLQHASKTILKAMNRPVGKTGYPALIYKLRTAIPGIVIRSTFIVGFPGEQKPDFLELQKFLKAMELDRVGVFTYSREENSPAYDLTPQIPKRTKENRMQMLMELQKEILETKFQKMLGTETEILVDWVDDLNHVNPYGRYYGQAPDIDGVTYILNYQNKKIKPGQFIKAVFRDYDDYDLYAEAL